MTVAVVAGGVGAARLLGGLIQVVDPASITAVVNTGDDVELHGLHISPDLDTITYTLAGAVNPETGWGLVGETWQAMDALSRYGGVTWFNLGDRDLGTHLFRTQRLREGVSLTEVTAEIVAGWDLGLRLVPMSDDPVRTMITVVDEGEIGFQDYFVRRHHDVVATDIRFAGASTARPAPHALGRPGRRRTGGHRPFQPPGVHRPGAVRPRTAGGGRGPAGGLRGRVPHHRRDHGQGPG